MNGAFKEVVRRDQRPFWQIVFIVLGSVILLNILITSCNYLGEKYAGIASLLVLFLTISVCSILIVKLIAYYRYRVAENRLIFEETIGNKSKILLIIDIDKIDSIKPYNEVKSDSEVSKTYKFVIDKDYSNFYVGEFSENGKKYRFVFKPSDRLLRILLKNSYSTVVGS